MPEEPQLAKEDPQSHGGPPEELGWSDVWGCSGFSSQDQFGTAQFVC